MCICVQIEPKRGKNDPAGLVFTRIPRAIEGPDILYSTPACVAALDCMVHYVDSLVEASGFFGFIRLCCLGVGLCVLACVV